MQWDDRVGRRLRLKDLHTLQTVAAVGSMAKASESLALSQPAISKAISDMEQTLGAPLSDLRLKDLHTLQTVAAVGSMAKSSERLALSQPAISKAISDMEQTLGAPLFDRSSSGVALTDCGRMLVERARVIFDEVRQGVLDIEHMSDPTRGEVRIGTIEPFTGVVSEIISQLVRRYPRISYHVTVSDADSLGRELRERMLDVLIVRWVPPLVADDLEAQVVVKASSFAVMAERRHPLLLRKKLNLADLMGERWTLSPPDSFSGRIVVDLFRRRKLPLPPTVATTISIYMRLNLLATGGFLTVKG